VQLELGERSRNGPCVEVERASELVGRGRRLGEPGKRALGGGESVGGTGSGCISPNDSRTSAADVAAIAPSRRSPLAPADSADVISPGMANTSLPSSSARSAVISAPLRSRASTTTVA